jgi:hypothetical protein
MDPAGWAAASILRGAGGGLRIKIYDEVAALGKLARVLGMYQSRLIPPPQAWPR